MDNRASKFNPLAEAPPKAGLAPTAGDLRDGSIYIYNEHLIDAVRVALAAHRPLLVSGPPGSGKSSLAPSIARHLMWRYYSVVVSSRTEAGDLLWSLDAVKRLADAQAQMLHQFEERYVEPGVLWWAFDPESARRRGLSEAQIGADLRATEPDELQLGVTVDSPAVLLIDEIDKADPDVPNDLLVPLGSYQFRAPNGSVIKANSEPLVVITTNLERDLPAAFKRRCIECQLPQPDEAQLVLIAKRHFGGGDEEEAIHRLLAQTTLKAGLEISGRRERPPSTAEFLDAIRAWYEMRPLIKNEDKLRETITNLAIRKGRAEAG